MTPARPNVTNAAKPKTTIDGVDGSAADQLTPSSPGDLSVGRYDLPPEVLRVVELFESAPIGQQLKEAQQQSGRCWRSATRFLSALRAHQLEGDLLCWSLPGATHGAVRVTGTTAVIDWTLAQFERDPIKAEAMAFPVVCTAQEIDDYLSAESYVLDFEDPFFLPAPDLMPEPLMDWEQARERIRTHDRPGKH